MAKQSGKCRRWCAGTLWVFCVLINPSRPGLAAAPQTKSSLTRAEVVELLEAGVPPKRVEMLARERGVGFELTPEVEKVLRRAGATSSLIETMRELVSPPSGTTTLLIESRPGGAQVFVDDELIARTSSDGRLKISTLAPGSHRVRVSLEGYPDFEQSINLSSGKSLTMTAALDSPKASPAVLQVESQPGSAAVYVDDEFLARTSSEGRLKVSTLAAGRHRLRVSATSYADYETDIDLVGGRTLTVGAVLKAAGQASGASRENARDGLVYVWIPPGRFTQGCSAGDATCFAPENPPHNVTISKGFWLGKTEVTVAAFKRYASVTGKVMPLDPVIVGKNHNPGWSIGNAPMVAVTWGEARDFCAWAGGRLPSEAEWEYAARAGSANARYDVLDDVAWYADNSGRAFLDSARILREQAAQFDNTLAGNGNTNHPVGQKKPNAFGLYDMLGSAWEWVNDWFSDSYYGSAPSVDPGGPASGETRVERGGSWQSNPAVVRASHRGALNPAVRWTDVGMRCALDAAP